MIPEELNKIFNELEEDVLNIYFTKAEFIENTFSASFTIKSISTDDINANDKRWTMQTVGHRRNRISFDEGSKIQIINEHPLLWEFEDVQCELYFNGLGSNPDKLHFELYKLHHSLFENYIPADTYFNSWHSYDLILAKNGLLARSAKKLLLKYAECLQNHGVDISILEGRSTTKSPNLVVLFMDATDTYIIAEDFLFTRQNT